MIYDTYYILATYILHTTLILLHAYYWLLLPLVRGTICLVLVMIGDRSTISSSSSSTSSTSSYYKITSTTSSSRSRS